MARLRAVIGLALASVVVAACNLLTGVGDLETVDDASASGKDSGPSVDANFVDVSDAADAKPIIDTGPPPQCPSAGHSCVKQAPAGWTGPFLINSEADAVTKPCPTEMPVNVDAPTGQPTAAFTCECRCGGVQNAKCAAFLQGYGDGVCTPPVVTANLPLDTCQTPGADQSFRANLALTDPGACNAFAAFKTKDDPAFPMLRACGRPTPFASDGCSADELCVPDGLAPFKPHTCILNDDSGATCPSPWTERYRVYDDLDDERDCGKGSCSCGAPAGTTCEGTMRSYAASTACAGASTAITIPKDGFTACTSAPAASSQRVQANTLKANGGACAVSGTPTPTGDVKGDGGSTICCVP